MDRSEFLSDYRLHHIDLCRSKGLHSVYELAYDKKSVSAIKRLQYNTIEDYKEHGCSYKDDLLKRRGIGKVKADEIARLFLLAGIEVRDIPDRAKHYDYEISELLIHMRYIDRHIGWLIDNTKNLKRKEALLTLSMANAGAYEVLVKEEEHKNE